MNAIPSIEPFKEHWDHLASHIPAENELRDALVKFRESLNDDGASHHGRAIGILDREMSRVLAKLNAADAEFLSLRDTCGPDDERIRELRVLRFHLSVDSLRLRASIRKLENYRADGGTECGCREGWDDEFKQLPNWNKGTAA